MLVRECAMNKKIRPQWKRAFDVGVEKGAHAYLVVVNSRMKPQVAMVWAEKMGEKVPEKA